MKRALALTTLAPLSLTLALASTTASADTRRASYDQRQASAEEATGFVSGAAIGGVLGGPPGAMAGAVIGALVGDGFNVRQRAGDLQAELYAAQLESAQLHENYQVALQELEQLRSGARVLPAYLPDGNSAIEFDNTALSVHFRSGSREIEAAYGTQLMGLVKLAQQLPTAEIEIIGFADRNGDAQQNLELSRQRSSAVQEFLNANGVSNASITTIAYGESRPLHDSQGFETDFFDRRVEVRLRDSSQSLLTQSAESQD